MTSTTVEEWRWIPGWEGKYEASNLGRIRSRKTGHYHILSLKHNNRTGYQYIILRGDDKPVTRSVHRLVAMTFLPNPDDLPEVNHINEIKTDNRVDNLEWCTTHHNNVHSKHKREKPVSVSTIDGEYLGCFKSRAAAAMVLGVGKARMTTALKESGVCNGFYVEAMGDDK